ERRAVERELLGDGAEDPLVQVLVRLALEELRAELRDALVVDARLQLGIRIGARLLLRRLVRLRAERALGQQLRSDSSALLREAVVETHDYALAKKRRFLAVFSGSGFATIFATSRIAFEKSAPLSPTTGGTPRLTASGTARSLGTSKRTFCSSADSTSAFFIPTLVLARLSVTRTLRTGNESSSSVCRLSRTFLIVGTSSEQTSSSSSVWSSVASIGPWKKGDVSTMITSYDCRATSSSAPILASVTSSASS